MQILFGDYAKVRLLSASDLDIVKDEVCGRIVKEGEGFIQVVGEHIYKPLVLAVGLFIFGFIPRGHMQCGRSITMKIIFGGLLIDTNKRKRILMAPRNI